MGRRKQPPPIVRLEVAYELASQERREAAVALFAALYREARYGKRGPRKWLLTALRDADESKIATIAEAL